MRTTIDMPDELFRQAKVRAALEGRKLKDLLTDFVREGLARPNAPLEDSARRRSPMPVGYRAAAGDEIIPSLSSAEIAAFLDEEDGERALRFAGR